MSCGTTKYFISKSLNSIHEVFINIRFIAANNRFFTLSLDNFQKLTYIFTAKTVQNLLIYSFFYNINNVVVIKEP